MLGAQLGVVAVRFDLYDRASNGAPTAMSARRARSAVELNSITHAPRKRRVAPQRRDHLVLFAFGRIVDDEERCHLLRALTNHPWSWERVTAASPGLNPLPQSWVNGYFAAIASVPRP